MKYVLSSLFCVILCAGVIGCDDDTAPAGSNTSAGAGQPPAASIASGKPVGLYFMTRYWIATRSLEKTVWYFAPDGTAYENLTTGFSAEDLANHKGRKGTLSREADNLVITWADGKKTAARFEPDKQGGGFGWDMGLFSPVKSFDDPKKIAGKYEGGESISFAGNSALTSRTIELKPDGTYTLESAASLTTTGDNDSKIHTGATGANGGKWELKGYTMTLTDNDGKVTKSICFPFDDEATPVYPDRAFFNGTMMKKLQ